MEPDNNNSSGADGASKAGAGGYAPQRRDDGRGGLEAGTSGSSSPQMHVWSGGGGGGGSPDTDESLLPLPVWMRESSKTFHWRWVPFRIRQASRSIVKWTKGPDPPQMQKITPFFPAVQEAPVRLIERYLPKRKHKAFLLAGFYCCWILVFSLVLVYSNSAGIIKGYGKPEPVWCGASYW